MKGSSLSIEAIYAQTSPNTTNEALNDYVKVQKVITPNEQAPVVFKDIPAWNGDLKKEYENNDHACAKGIVTMAILNGPTDIEEFVSAVKQIRELFGGEPSGYYNHKIAQHPFAFFRGTILQDYLNPNSDKCVDRNWAIKILKTDKSLFETKLGAWLRSKLGVRINGRLVTEIEDLDHSYESPHKVEALILGSSNEFADLTARALLRTTKFGTLTLCGLGALHAGYRIKDGKDPQKELAKAAIEVATTITAVGYLGGAGHKYFGTLGSITGTALGLATGAASHKTAEKLFEKVS